MENKELEHKCDTMMKGQAMPANHRLLNHVTTWILPTILLVMQIQPALLIIGGSQCRRDRPGFGCHAVSEKLRAIQYYRVFNIIILKLYNVL
jgi:hypothetical protein